MVAYTCIRTPTKYVLVQLYQHIIFLKYQVRPVKFCYYSELNVV